MKILYHHRTQGKGVEGVHINSIVDAWRSSGHTVDIVSPSKNEAGIGSASNKNSLKSKIFTNLSKHMPELGFELLEIVYNVIASLELRRRMRKEKYDLIYERYAFFSWAGVKASLRYKVPIILEVNYTSLNLLVRKRSTLLKPLSKAIDLWLFKRAAGIIVVSTFLKNQMIALGIDPEKIIVLPNAANPKTFSPGIANSHIRERFGLKGKKVIGFVGGFYPWHGVDILVRVFKGLCDENHDTVLALIGNGPMRPILEKQVSESGIEKRVLFLDSVPHKELPAYIDCFDIAVMPDSNDYGSPMKIFEYMALAKPVVAPHLGPLLDCVEDGKEGILFEPKDERGLTSALSTLLRNDSLRTEMGSRGREMVIKRFNWKNNSDEVIKLYRRVAKKGL